MGVTRPTATGTLGKRPFCELLVYILSHRLSGSLVLEEQSHTRHALIFAEGAPLKAKVIADETRLGEIARVLGMVDADTVEALAESPGDGLFGQRLLAMGLLEPPALERALAEQLCQQIAWLSRLSPETAYGYYEQQDFLQKWAAGPISVDPLALIATSVWANPPIDRVRQACARLQDLPLRLHPASRIARFGFAAKPRVVIDVLRAKPQPLAELEATGLLDRDVLHTLLYILIITAHLDVGTAPLAVSAEEVQVAPESRRMSSARVRLPGRNSLGAGPPSSSVRAAPVPKPAAGGITREQVEAKLAQLEEADHYALLEVSPAASSAEIAAAFPALARRWHPDRLGPENAEHREAVTRIFARLTDVQRTLTDPELRRAYDEQRAGAAAEASEQEQVQRVLLAVTAFRKAEVLVKKRDFAGAEELAYSACTNDPEQPEYVALHAWIQARRKNGEGNFNEILRRLDDAVRRQSNNVRIHYYRACVLKLAGQDEDAMREFRHVAAEDPNNVEAVREIRLHEMRQQEQAQAEEASRGLFGRLFKRT